MHLVFDSDFNVIVFFSLQVNPSDMSNDSDLAFTTEFYKNLKILSQDLYKRSASTAVVSHPVAVAGPSEKKSNRLQSSGSFGSLRNLEESVAGATKSVAAPRVGADSSMYAFNPASLIADEADNASIVRDSAAAPAASADYFSPESMQERMRMYLAEGGVPIEFVERYSLELKTRHDEEH